MSKKLIAALFVLVFGVSVSLAQSAIKQWEYLEVSQINSFYDFETRKYNFFNEGKVVVSGTTSLDWLGKSGWELVSAISSGESNSETRLVFKRLLNEQRTKHEIEELEKTFKARTNPPTADLIDLDAQEARQKLDEYNLKAEERMKIALSKINNLPVKIINVKSSAYNLNETRLTAEIVVDGTSVLLKGENKYRSSEAKNYLQEVRKQVVNSLEPGANLSSQDYNRFQIGEFSVNNRDGISIGISVAVNYKEKQNVVAQGGVSGNWKEAKP